MTIGTVRSEVGKRLDLDRIALGIPADAEIFDIQFTPRGSSSGAICPAPMPGHWRAGLRQQILTFIGVPVQSPTEEVGTASLMINWATPTDIPTRHLIGAVRAFIEGRYDDMVVPANVAVESAIGETMFAWVNAFVDKDRTETFLTEGATYSHQLNVLIRILARVLGAPALHGRIRNLLDELRKARNDVAHQGKLDKPLDKERAAELAAAAAFGMHYGRLLLDAVRTARAKGELPR
jgi:hypothetical protein